ncbi:Histone acetyltransferase complex SAGA/ADA, subunit ADA2 [Ceraceosorus bombacis]|uniref:Histone acetyltransferase complex SAGA/ADA, subunit ADA2 n=1 Tax=Ceraceosorus bombacis TaxID=401625 RepID=A0A0P1BLG2_9BASI|nr:Histone acetyltransferase complex SAGA/ADA, subunit ADA2 [Ceraceosorus bombacis]
MNDDDHSSDAATPAPASAVAGTSAAREAADVARAESSSVNGTPAPADVSATVSVEVNSAAAGTSTAASNDDQDNKMPDWDEHDGDLDLKLLMLEIYNDKLDRRARRKLFLFERNLVDYRRTKAAEMACPLEERQLLSRIRHFAQLQTAMDFESFLNGLLYEEELRKTAAQLQTYRRAGITSFAQADKYEKDVAERNRKAAVAAAEGGLAAFPASGAAGTPRRNDSSSSLAAMSAPAASSKRAREGKAGSLEPSAKRVADNNKTPRAPPKPLDLSSAPSLHLLTQKEAALCSAVRILPGPYLIMKKEILTEYMRRGKTFSRRDSRCLFKMDVNKVGKVYDLLVEEGYLEQHEATLASMAGLDIPSEAASQIKLVSTHRQSSQPNGMASSS